MQKRIETRINGEAVMTVMCRADISDGDLAAMLQDAEQDLRWNVMKDAETVHIKPEGGADVTQLEVRGNASRETQAAGS